MTDVPGENVEWPAAGEGHTASDYYNIVLNPIEEARLFTEALVKLKKAGF